MGRPLEVIGRVAVRVKWAALWLVRKLRGTCDRRVVEELKAQQDATAQQVMDHLTGLDAYRRALAGDDPVKQALLIDIEKQAVLTIHSKLTSGWGR